MALRKLRPAPQRTRRPFDVGFLLAAGVCGLFYTWVLAGSFPLADRVGAREHYYTVAAVALLHGRLDVPARSLEFECFMVHNHCYGYFGLAPSLLRLPVALVWGAGAETDQVERLFLVLGFLAIALGAWWLSRQLVGLWAPSAGRRAKVMAGLLAGVAGLGASPLIFLASRPLVYEEATLWGVAFALVALGAAISLRRHARASTLAILLLADLGGLLSRPTVGASGILATLVLAVCFRRSAQEYRAAGEATRSRRARRFSACLLAGAALAMMSAPVVAYAKFGSFSPPYRDQVLVRANPSWLAILGHPGGVNPRVLPTKLLSTLRPDSLLLFNHPPYVAIGEAVPKVLWPARPSDVTWEMTSSITATLPFSSLLALAGLVLVAGSLWKWVRARPPVPRPVWVVTVVGALGALGVGLAFPGQAHRYAAVWVPLSLLVVWIGCRRAFRWWRAGAPDPRLEISVMVTISALAALGLGLMFPGQTFRYLADWLPLLFIAVAIGLAGLAATWPSRRWRAGVVVGVLAATLAGQLVVQTAAAVRNGLTSSYWYPVAATCPGLAAHYGVLGTTFCPAGLWPP